MGNFWIMPLLHSLSDIIIAIVSLYITKDKLETLLLLYQNILRLYFQMRSVVRRGRAYCIRRAVSELVSFYLNYIVGQCSHTFFYLGIPLKQFLRAAEAPANEN